MLIWYWMLSSLGSPNGMSGILGSGSGRFQTYYEFDQRSTPWKSKPTQFFRITKRFVNFLTACRVCKVQKINQKQHFQSYAQPDIFLQRKNRSNFFKPCQTVFYFLSFLISDFVYLRPYRFSKFLHTIELLSVCSDSMLVPQKFLNLPKHHMGWFYREDEQKCFL